MPPKAMQDMPEDEKSRPGHIAAAKTPPEPAKTKSAKREARLAEALRINLRRRKAGAKTAGNESKTPEGQEQLKDE